MSIREKLNKIKTAIYGSEVRQAIHDAIQQAYDDASEKDNANMEVKMARGTHPNLNSRLEEVDDKQQQTTAQLAEKTTKGEVNINHFDEPTRQTFLEAQGIDVNYVLGEDNVKIENIAFTKKSTNIFNSAEQKENFYIDIYSDGEEVAGESFIASGFIRVEPETEYYIRMVNHIAFYDDKQEYLDNDGVRTREHHVTTTPPNAKFMRISWLKSSHLQQVNKGNEQLPYQDYFIKIDKDYVEPREINESDLPDIPINKLGFVTQSSNLFNKDSVTSDHYVNTNSGILVNASNFVASDYIPIAPNQSYIILRARRYAFYDKDKTFISGKPDATPTRNLVVEAPENAYFIRFSWYDSDESIHDQQMNLGNTLLPYEPFGYVIKNEFLPDYMDTEELIVTLPPKIYALVGQELNIYFDNIIGGRAKDYDFDITCPIGAQFEEYYRVVPESTGTFNLRLVIIKDNKEIGVATSELIVSSKQTGSGETRNLLVIGDSTTAGGATIRKLQENLIDDALDVNFIGTKGTHPHNHEGISGWTARQFVTVPGDHNLSDIKNSFWNLDTESFDFSHYMNKNGFSNLDYVILNLGINDTFSYYSDESVHDRIDEFIGQYEEMISSVHNYDSNIKIGISLTIPPAYSQDAFGRSYGNGQTRRRYKRNNILLVEELIKKFDNKEGENLYLVPINTNLDTKHNFPTDFNNPEVPVNARNTDVMVKNYAVNAGVHPAQSGYWQTADVYWYWLKSFEV